MITNIDNPAGQTMSPLGPLQLLGVTRPTTALEDLGLRNTSARSSVTTLTKKDIMQPSVSSHQSQKTSTGLVDLRVGD